MGKDILIRGFDEKSYGEMSDIADRQGVTITSFIKNLIDQRLKDKTYVPQKHDLILYGNDASIEFMLKSLDRLTKDGDLFRAFCAPDDSNFAKLFRKLKWFDGTILPYEKNPAKLSKYLNNVITKISKKAENQLVCLIDCVLEDIAKTSLKKALSLEDEYNKDRLKGLTFCTYKIDVLINGGIEGMLEFFTRHDQIFILKNNEMFKMHLTKENTQKLLLD